MGEIKSTLDLVMEKTRHLSLSAEEKIEQEKEETKKVLSGLLQKYQDTLISLADLKTALDSLQKKHAFADKRFLAGEIAEKITITQDSHLLLGVLKEIFDISTDVVESIYKEFQSAVRERALQQIEANKKQLAETRHISGSAVIPNIEKDESWMAQFQNITEDFDQRLDTEKVKMIQSL